MLVQIIQSEIIKETILDTTILVFKCTGLKVWIGTCS